MALAVRSWTEADLDETPSGREAAGDLLTPIRGILTVSGGHGNGYNPIRSPLRYRNKTVTTASSGNITTAACRM
jgi:hypothetical protein